MATKTIPVPRTGVSPMPNKLSNQYPVRAEKTMPVGNYGPVIRPK